MKYFCCQECTGRSKKHLPCWDASDQLIQFDPAFGRDVGAYSCLKQEGQWQKCCRNPLRAFPDILLKTIAHDFQHIQHNDHHDSDRGGWGKNVAEKPAEHFNSGIACGNTKTFVDIDETFRI